MEWNIYKEEFDKKANEKINWLELEFIKIKTGRPNPNILDSILVNAYDTKSKIIEIANIQVVEGKQLIIKPYDKSLLQNINQEILKSNLGLTPQVDADLLRINFPPQTEEVRKNSVKKCKEILEQAKVGIRNIRNDIHKKYKNDKELREDELKQYDNELDKITKSYNSKLDELFSMKEKELLSF